MLCPLNPTGERVIMPPSQPQVSSEGGCSGGCLPVGAATASTAEGRICSEDACSGVRSRVTSRGFRASRQPLNSSDAPPSSYARASYRRGASSQQSAAPALDAERCSSCRAAHPERSESVVGRAGGAWETLTATPSVPRTCLRWGPRCSSWVLQRMAVGACM